MPLSLVIGNLGLEKVNYYEDVWANIFLVIEPCTVWLLPFLATTFFGSGLCETSWKKKCTKAEKQLWPFNLGTMLFSQPEWDGLTWLLNQCYGHPCFLFLCVNPFSVWGRKKSKFIKTVSSRFWTHCSVQKPGDTSWSALLYFWWANKNRRLTQ